MRSTPKQNPAGFDLDIDGTPVRVRLVPRAGATRYVLRVQPAEAAIRLTLPPQGTLGEARAFAERNRDWIRTRLASLPAPVAFADGAVIPYRGADHVIEHRPEARGTVWLEPGAADPLLAEDALPRICVAGRLSHLPRRLRDWLGGEAERRLAARVRAHARAAGVTVSRVSIRDQKTRWGACSGRGTLTFSWRLVMAPDFVLDYLAAHEVTHLREMNHSPRFWRMLRAACAETDRAEAWLKRHGRGLHRYG